MLEFEKIRRKRTQELKEEDWKDLQTAEDRRKEKRLYKWFLRIPYIMLGLSMLMTIYPGTWFVSNVTFYIWIMLLIMTLVSMIAIPFVHRIRYPIKLSTMVGYPILIYLSLFLVFVLGLTCVPITINNETAQKFTLDRQYSLDFVYYSSFETTEDNLWNVVALTPIAEYKYSKEINGRTVLELPSTYGASSLVYSSVKFPSRIDGLVLNRNVKGFFDASELDVIYYYGGSECSVYSNNNLIVYYRGDRPMWGNHFTYIEMD
jgi:hypothetical protein